MRSEVLKVVMMLLVTLVQPL